MADTLQSPVNSQMVLTKLKTSLDLLNSRLNDPAAGDIAAALSETLASFGTFFSTVADSDFTPQYLLDNDTAQSSLYNDNLRGMFNDITRFYDELKNLTDAQIKSYNFSQIVAKEILTRADFLASTVLDLNILNNFNRSDMIVAGDDFRNLDHVDMGAGVASTQAEAIPDGGGMSLARDTTRDLVDSSVKVTVVPLSPISSAAANGLQSVNTQPTPGNIERFYEGNYYSFLGQARPEGGEFNLKYMLEPANNNASNDTVTEQPTVGINVGLATRRIGGSTTDTGPTEADGKYVDLGATEEQKQAFRLKMFDKDPSTFWECEFLYKAPAPLISDPLDTAAVESTSENPNAPAGATISIDLAQAEQAAQQYDLPGRDLIVDIILTFPDVRPVNFVTINPILFGIHAFPEVVDLATAGTDDGEFITVDGWDRIRFARSITPEANEFLTDSQLGATLSPSRYSYKGQGIYPFPVREAKKIKIQLKTATPVSCVYERTYALLSRQLEVETTTTTTTKKGLLSF